MLPPCALRQPPPGMMMRHILPLSAAGHYCSYASSPWRRYFFARHVTLLIDIFDKGMAPAWLYFLRLESVLRRRQHFDH